MTNVSQDHDDDIEPLKKGNSVYIIMIFVLVAMCVLVLAVSVGGKSKEKQVKDDLEVRVSEEYEPSIKNLTLPKDKPRDERVKELNLEQRQQRTTAQRQGLLSRPAAEEEFVANAPPLAPPGEQGKSQDELREEKRIKDMWNARREASTVVFNKNMRTESDGSRQRERNHVDVDAIAASVRRDAAAAGTASPTLGGQTGGGASRDDMEGRAIGKRTVVTYATNIQNASYTLTQGAMLDCVLETAISSQLPGYTRCILSDDVYSYDGSNLLARKGSRVIGQYQGGIQQGESRIFVMWNRILSTDGIDVALDSPGTSALGASGHEAYINSHFLERFGASALLSIIGGLAASESDGDVRLKAAGDSFNKSAEIALQNSIRIRPSGHINQGERIKIFVAKDIDFGPALRIARR